MQEPLRTEPTPEKGVRRCGARKGGDGVRAQRREHQYLDPVLTEDTWAVYWAKAANAGRELLEVAGGDLGEAAKALWRVGEDRELEDLEGAEDSEFGELIEENVLACLRELAWNADAPPRKKGGAEGTVRRFAPR